jgi:hypothetical protein
MTTASNEVVWKRGDVHPETGRVFLGKQSSCKDGLRFVTKEEFEKRKAYGSAYSKRTDYKEKQKISRNTDQKRDLRNEYAKAWRKLDEQREKSAKRQRERRKNDPLFAIAGRVRARINESIRLYGYTKKSSIYEILGCDWDEFNRHIEAQFPKGMNWQNRDKWHVDHIIPICSAKSEHELLSLNHFTNLRPIWAEENRKKNGKHTLLL